MKKRWRYIIGIDEVGRGALAGPVTVAAVLLPRRLNIKNQISKIQIKNKELKLRDSKRLLPEQREIWFQYIKTRMNADPNADERRYISVNQCSNQPRSAICYAVANVSPRMIDRINIAQAANLAAARAFKKVIRSLSHRSLDFKVFLDGGLYLNKSNIKNKKLKTQIKNEKRIKTIIKGDEKIPAIMLASIVAKVTRDRYMKKLHRKYPQYNFINNVGYGTKKHIGAVKRYGHTDVHRLTFLKKYIKI